MAKAKAMQEDTWRVFRIMSEFVDGFETMSRIGPAVSIFGSARTPRSDTYYHKARKLAAMLAEDGLAIITGGGPGIMEAANRGAHDVGAKTIGLNIVLPFEQAPNPYITPELSFQFHYFAIRKMHFLMRAKGLVVFPGGFGTLDEFFEILTLVQTRKVQSIPIVLFGKGFWQRAIRFDVLVDEGTISARDLELFHYVETAEEAWEAIKNRGNERLSH